MSANAATRCDCNDPYDAAACTDGAARMDEAEQPPVARHFRKVVNGWGVSLCGADDGVLAERDVTCLNCIERFRALVTSERDG